MSHDYALYHKSSLLYANDPRDYIPIDFYPLDVFHAQTENVYEMINWPLRPPSSPLFPVASPFASSIYTCARLSKWTPKMERSSIFSSRVASFLIDKKMTPAASLKR